MLHIILYIIGYIELYRVIFFKHKIKYTIYFFQSFFTSFHEIFVFDLLGGPILGTSVNLGINGPRTSPALMGPKADHGLDEGVS